MKDNKDGKWSFFAIQDKFSRRVIIVTICLFVGLGYSQEMIDLIFTPGETLTASKLNALTTSFQPKGIVIRNKNLITVSAVMDIQDKDISLDNNTAEIVYSGNSQTNFILNLDREPEQINGNPDPKPHYITIANSGWYDFYIKLERTCDPSQAGCPNYPNIKIESTKTNSFPRNLGTGCSQFPCNPPYHLNFMSQGLMKNYHNKAYLEAGDKLYFNFSDGVNGEIPANGFEIKLIKVQDI